jgi:hypothetical protein
MPVPIQLRNTGWDTGVQGQIGASSGRNTVRSLKGSIISPDGIFSFAVTGIYV